jgi:hypothetical protein
MTIKTTAPRRVRLCRAPLAITPAGDIVVSVMGLEKGNTIARLVERAQRVGGKVFIGVVITGRVRAYALNDIEALAVDLGGRLGGALVARAKKQALRSRKPRPP